LVLALGAGERLAGVSRFDDAQEVKALPRVGGYVDPSVEAVVALRPGLVLVEPSPGNRAAVERMAKLGVPVLAVPLQSVPEILAAMPAVAEALGLGERGAALASRTRERLEALRREAAGGKAMRVLLVYDWEPLVVAGPGSFGDSLLAIAGAQNAAADARTAYPVYSFERVMKARPEVIIDAADVQDPPRARILKLPGVAGARVERASPSLFRPGPRLADAAEELRALVHAGAPRE
ncbi:MAG: ABC transporter substrate-binding protein, partial [Myxococcales bacterium]